MYPSGERPLDTGPEVIGLIRFSAFVIRPIEELADRTGARCEGPPSGWPVEGVLQVLPGIDAELLAGLGEAGQDRQGPSAPVRAEEQPDGMTFL